MIAQDEHTLHRRCKCNGGKAITLSWRLPSVTQGDVEFSEPVTVLRICFNPDGVSDYNTAVYCHECGEMLEAAALT